MTTAEAARLLLGWDELLLLTHVRPDGDTVEASITSDSLMAPTPPWMTRTRTSSLLSFSREAFTASTEP